MCDFHRSRKMFFTTLIIFAYLCTACSQKGASLLTPSALPTDQTPLATASPFPSETLTSVPERLFVDLGNAGALQQAEQITNINAETFSWLSGQPGMLAISMESSVVVFGIDAPAELLQIETVDPSLLTVSPVQKNVAWVSQGDTIYMWNMAEAQTPYTLQSETAVTSLAFSPAGGNLAAANFGGDLQVVDAASGQIMMDWELPNWLANLSYSPDGKMLGGVDQPNFTVYILDAANGQVLRKLYWDQTTIPDLYGAYFSADWRQIAWVARGTVQMMDVNSAALGVALQHEDSVSAIAWSPDGSLLATACAATVDGNFAPTVQIWDPMSGQRLGLLVQPQPVQKLSFSENGEELGVLYRDGTMQIWAVVP